MSNIHDSLHTELLDIPISALWLWIELATTSEMREGCNIERFVYLMLIVCLHVVMDGQTHQFDNPMHETKEWPSVRWIFLSYPRVLQNWSVHICYWSSVKRTWCWKIASIYFIFKVAILRKSHVCFQSGEPQESETLRTCRVCIKLKNIFIRPRHWTLSLHIALIPHPTWEMPHVNSVSCLDVAGVVQQYKSLPVAKLCSGQVNIFHVLSKTGRKDMKIHKVFAQPSLYMILNKICLK
jgi:hypothetical protein